MARPIKQGLDYFPLDTVLDSKLELFEAEFGLEGFGFIIKLFQKIYDNGYFCEWNEDEQLLFAKKINVDNNRVNVYINSAIKRNIFNKELFEKYSILTSRGVQRRFAEAIKRRKQVEIIKEYILIDLNSQEFRDLKSKIIYVSINGINVNNNDSSCQQNVCNNSQSKVKESKVNNNIYTTTTLYINNNIRDDKNVEECVVVDNDTDAYLENDIVIDFYNKNIDKITEYSRGFINSYREKGFTDDMIIYAMQIAVNQKKKTIAYIQGILEDWRKKDITSVLEAKQAAEEYKNAKSKNSKCEKNLKKEYEQRNYEDEKLNSIYANKT